MITIIQLLAFALIGAVLLFTKRFHDVFITQLKLWFLIILILTLNFRPWNWLHDTAQISQWGGMLSLVGVCLTFAAQARLDRSISSAAGLSNDRFYKAGFCIAAAGTIIWAVASPAMDDILALCIKK